MFRRLELFISGTQEVEPAIITLEHIAPQSDRGLAACVGMIGNLLPLGTAINNEAGDKTYVEKKAQYKASKLNVVADFLKTNGHLPQWGALEINNRTSELADFAFAKVWTI